MHTKHSQIRARARQLLDDNIFGNDWIKGALFQFLLDLFTVAIGVGLFPLTSLIIVNLVNLVGDKSIILVYAIPVIFYFFDLLLLFIIIGPFRVGSAAVYTDLVRNGDGVKIHKFFYGFKNFFANFILGVMYVIQVSLWSVFFVIPGIYVAYSYALVFHVKRDHPEYSWKYCFDESERLMDGKRFKLFKLQISHLGWFIVGGAFLGVGMYWAEPYLETSVALFYEEAKASR